MDGLRRLRQLSPYRGRSALSDAVAAYQLSRARNGGVRRPVGDKHVRDQTQSELRKLSENIIAHPATITGFADGLMEAANRINRDGNVTPSLNMARNWSDTLDPAAQRIASACSALKNAPSSAGALPG